MKFPKIRQAVVCSISSSCPWDRRASRGRVTTASPSQPHASGAQHAALRRAVMAPTAAGPAAVSAGVLRIQGCAGPDAAREPGRPKATRPAISA